MSRKPTLPEHDRRCESTELYEQVETVHSSRRSRPENRYIESNFQEQPSMATVATNASITAVTQDKDKKRNSILIALTASTATFLLCLLVVCLVAVILYSPQVRRGNSEDLLSRIEQLEEQLEAKQVNNQTQVALTSLQEQQESFEATLTSQFQSVQNLVQSMSSVQNNTALTLTQLDKNFHENLLLHALDNLTALQIKFDQLSAFDSTVTSQFVSMQNLIQSMSSVQNNHREDLDRLRSVDLYQSCFQDTSRRCTMSTGGSSSYYSISCGTGGYTVNPTVSFKCVCMCVWWTESKLLMTYCMCMVSNISTPLMLFGPHPLV